MAGACLPSFDLSTEILVPESAREHESGLLPPLSTELSELVLRWKGGSGDLESEASLPELLILDVLSFFLFSSVTSSFPIELMTSSPILLSSFVDLSDFATSTFTSLSVAERHSLSDSPEMKNFGTSLTRELDTETPDSGGDSHSCAEIDDLAVSGGEASLSFDDSCEVRRCLSKYKEIKH